MTARILASCILAAAMLLSRGTALAAPATTQPLSPAFNPTTQPAEKPLPAPITASAAQAAAVKGKAPATAPTTNPVAQNAQSKFPSPSELIARMQHDQAEEEKLTKVAYFDLNGEIAEKPQEFSFFDRPGDATSLRTLINRMKQARDDKDVRAILITLGA